MKFLKKIICFSMFTILIDSCKENNKFPFQILDDNRNYFLFKIVDIDSIYYFREYPDTLSIYEYTNNIADDILKKHNWKLESNLSNEKEYSMFILFKNGKSKIVEYTSNKEKGIQFIMQCDFVKFFEGDILDVNKKKINNFDEFYIKLRNKKNPYYHCFDFTNIEFDSSKVE